MPVRLHAFALSLLFCVSAAAPLRALQPDRLLTQYLRDSWQTEQGLPQNSVNAIEQTRDGYLWLGTEEGVVRFDGVRFTIFNRANTPALPHNSINALFEDSRGRLLIGTSRGLVIESNGRFTAIHTPSPLRVVSFAKDRRGQIWIGTLGDGVQRLDGARLVPEPSISAAGGKRIRAIREDRNGTLWFATEAGVVRRKIDGTIDRLDHSQRLIDDNTFALSADADGSMWIGTDSGLQRYDGLLFTTFTRRNGLGGDRVRDLMRDRDGNLWIATQGGGISRMRRDGHIEFLDASRGLSSDVAVALREDVEGTLWVGTSGGGLVRLRDGQVATIGRPEGLPDDVVYSILEDRTGALLFGTRGGGLARMQNGIVTVLSTKNGLPSDAVISIAEDVRGVVWLGTYGGGLVRLENGGMQNITARSGLANDSVYSLLASRDGSLWVGTGGGGLQRMKDGHLTTIEGLPSPFVQALDESSDGTLWIGTAGGLSRLQNGRLTTWTTRDGLPDLSVLTLHQSADGALWIGTPGRGLARFRDGHFSVATTRQGLLDDMIGRILEDGRGHLWMSSDHGVFSVARSDLDALFDGRRRSVPIVSFGTSDGMRSAECYGGTQPAGWATRDGRLLFPTIRGAVSIDPGHLRRNVLPPPVHIEAARADRRILSPENRLELPAGTHTLEISYTALSLADPTRVHFRYRLEGFDPDWTDAGTRRTAYYTSLPHGDYRFRVLASNNDGVWSPAGALMTFHVAPHFYETPWFRALAAIAIIALLYALYWLRVWRLKARQRELLALVEARTSDLNLANEELARLARMDGLTRIANRRAFDEALAKAWADHRRRNAPLAVILCDVDHFKKYNDSRGHQAGDAALVAIAGTLAGALQRESDLAARYGGEELVLLLPDTDAAGAMRVAQIVTEAIHALAMPHGASDTAGIVTLSMGVATMAPSADEAPASLVARADAALYRAKQEGRNRAVAG